MIHVSHLLFVLSAVLISLAVTYLLIRSEPLHGSLTADVGDGPQKFHAHQVSRVGGIGIVVGVMGAMAVSTFLFPNAGPGSVAGNVALLFVCAIPALAAGLAEDITKKVGVFFRLASTMVSAGIAYFALDGVLNHVGVAGLDFALAYPAVSLLFTMVAVAGIANAINIVDGCNGLAGMVSIIILLGLALVAYAVGDSFVLGAAILLAGAIAGFLVWNFPRGRIFLGDGGAYFVGFMIAELSVLLVRRQPEVSPWFPLLLVAYPVWETLFSIYRKKFLRGMSPGEPDGMHFHMLVYKRVVRWKVTSRDPNDRVERNSLTSPYLWTLTLFTVIPAVLLWRNTVELAFLAFAFGLFYNWLYRRMTLFRVPKWLIICDVPERAASAK